MGAALRHRGPDGHGHLSETGAAIGTERLKVIDLDNRADQPFQHNDLSVWLACNGEVYNAASLKRRLSHYRYRTRSDIEPLLPLYSHLGPDGIRHIDGMFALAIWDRYNKRLVLARDRAGEKPLFYTRLDEEIWFASEIQALRLHPGLPSEIDENALSDYLRYGYVREPRTMHAAVRKVEAGTVMCFDHSGERVVRYWNPESVETEPQTPERARKRLATLIESAVSKQVAADVPVGIFTSGGVDSSLLTALAVSVAGSRMIHTFTVKFATPSYDESTYAKHAARTLGSVHVEVPVEDDALVCAFEKVTGCIAEPISDPALLPTYLLARRAKEHVSVVLSGEGADELFGGYPTYLGHLIAPAYNRLGRAPKSAVALAVKALPVSTRKVPAEFLLRKFISAAELPWQERHVHWFGSGLPEVQRGAQCANPPEVLVHRDGVDPVSGAMLMDYRTYLRDNLLVKVDRATMLASLEARAPYLDRFVTSFALSLPTELRIRRLTTKWILKRVARQWLPRRIVHRRKRGLSVPIGAWINGILRHEADRLLEPRRLESQGLLHSEPVRHLLSEHRSGRANHARPLWSLIVLQRWLERWAPGAC